jgi:2-C-methyl-D-erythritol 2,4-cyclodiphosphate synthase
VTIESVRGALGHSDADVVCHAVTDAVLGAASLGDIGTHFPDTDPQWKNAPSRLFLRHAFQLAKAQDFAVANADVTILAERPKLKPFKRQMVESVEQLLGGAQVNIKAGTNEQCDAIGRGEAIAAHAVVLLGNYMTPLVRAAL